MGQVISIRQRLEARLDAVESAGPPRAAEDLGVLALRHERVLLRRAIRLTRDRTEAEDLLHDTFERLLRNADRFRPETNLLVWMYTVMNNLFVDRCRRKARGPGLVADGEDAVPAPDLSPPAPPRWARVTQEQFAGAVAGLPADFRVVFELHALEGRPYDEIAGRLGIAKNTVGTRLFRARSLLRDTLADLVDEGEESA